MGNYTDPTTVIALVPALPQTTTATGYAAVKALVTKCITQAEGVVNGYCARRFAVPFSTSICPPMIATIAENLTLFYAMKGLYAKDSVNVQRAYETAEDAMAILREIRERELDLVDANGSLIADRSIDTIIKASSQDYEPTFDQGDPLNWRVDPDLIDDIATSKE